MRIKRYDAPGIDHPSTPVVIKTIDGLANPPSVNLTSIGILFECACGSPSCPKNTQLIRMDMAEAEKIVEAVALFNRENAQRHKTRN